MQSEEKVPATKKLRMDQAETSLAYLVNLLCAQNKQQIKPGDFYQALKSSDMN